MASAEEILDNLNRLPPAAQYIALMEHLGTEQKYNAGKLYYPDDGPLRRELYKVHTDFFDAGSQYRERCIIAANRIGKSELGAFECYLHLTGDYPAWWRGRRFPNSVNVWASGDTTQTVRDIAQFKLLGSITDIGTGMIPKTKILDMKKKAGSVPDCFETVRVRHAKGGVSTLTFKSYDQKRKSFQGTHQDLIWLDEECPPEIYDECLMRTADTGGRNGHGLVMLTFTPLSGLTPVVLAFLPGGKLPEEMEGKYVINATWDDVPHLSAEEKAELLEGTMPHLRDARSKGIPQLGSGAIFPVSEEGITVDDFPLPEYWPRVYGLDVGWKKTAAVWSAHDLESDTIYLYSCYLQGQMEPAVHAAAIRGRGDWIPGVIDPASRGRSQTDGKQLMRLYEDAGLDLQPADNTVEAGLFDMYKRMTEGRLKVFRSLHSWFDEFRIYRRDDNGKVVKDNDHLMDSTRYLVRSGLPVASTGQRKRARWWNFYQKSHRLERPRGGMSA